MSPFPAQSPVTSILVVWFAVTGMDPRNQEPALPVPRDDSAIAALALYTLSSSDSLHQGGMAS